MKLKHQKKPSPKKPQKIRLTGKGLPKCLIGKHATIREPFSDQRFFIIELINKRLKADKEVFCLCENDFQYIGDKGAFKRGDKVMVAAIVVGCDRKSVRVELENRIGEGTITTIFSKDMVKGRWI